MIRRTMFLVVAAWAVTGCKSRTASTPSGDTSDAWFTEVGETVALATPHVAFPQRRHDFPEIIGAGVCLLDFDDDGWLDVYLVQGGDVRAAPGTAGLPGNTLHRNRGDGTFEDVTASSGTGDTGYGMGCAVGDIDLDGDLDLYVTNVGPNVLLRNDGNGRFTDITAAAGVGSSAWSTSAAFVDIDQDRDFDLVAINYISWAPERELTCSSRGNRRDYCQPNNYNAPARDLLYRNNGDGTFTDIVESAGLGTAFGNGLGIAIGNLVGDPRPELYVANDGTANQMWVWDDTAQRYRDDALLAGCALNRAGLAEAGMGVSALDIDHDGDLDLFMSHLRGESNTLYLNNGGMFDDVTAQFGLGAASTAFTGFGLGFADFDHDGYLDTFVANGRVMIEEPLLSPEDPYVDPNLLFAGGPGGHFHEVLPRGGTATPLLRTSRGAAFGDLDNDGDVDIVVANNHARPDVLRNDVGSRGHWIMLDIRDRCGSPAVGATVALGTASRTWTRRVEPAYSYCSSNDARVHCGLGEASAVERVTVAWPDGRSTEHGPLPAGRIHRITAPP